MDLFILMLLLVLLYGQCRFPLNQYKPVRRMILTYFKDMKTGERLLRQGITLALGGIILAYISLGVHPVYRQIAALKFHPIAHVIIIILSILAFVQVFFLVTFLVSLIRSEKSTGLVQQINLLAMDPRSFFITGYVVPIVVAVFEAFVFYQILYYMLRRGYGIPLYWAILIVSLLYGLLKSLMRQSQQRAIAFFIMGFSLSLVGALLTGATHLIIGMIYMFLCLLFTAFKDMKINLGRKT